MRSRVIQFAVAAMLSLWSFISCGPSKKGLFADKRSAHEKYADRIKEAGLDNTPMGSMWFMAAAKSLNEPLRISLPYKETGYFAAERPSAAGYVFDARRGDRLKFSVSLIPVTTTSFFAELWKPGAAPEDAELLAVADSTFQINHEVEEDGQYVLRLQPELLQGIEYSVTINAGPSLAFPVSETGRPRLVSFWRDPRDGGTRSHQGVDISAAFRTPAVASADGHVSRVMENRLGGKVVFMRPRGKKYSLYYAHLDTQLVSTGDEVKTGDVLGLVGTTGNAKNTAPHLHFGIYTMCGAVDPLPFIDTRRKAPAEITSPGEWLNNWIRTSAATRLSGSPSAKSDTLFDLERGTALLVLGATANWLRVQLPDGRQGYVTSQATTTKLLEKENTDTLARILDQPFETAAAKRTLTNDTVLDVVGTYGEYLLVRMDDDHGWLRK